MPNMEEILPPKQKPKQLDPISDIMAATKGIPIAAFPGQNHDAHAQVKGAYLQDPMNGKNPAMQRIKPVLEANIQEHMVHKYQEQVNGVVKTTMEQMPQQTPEIMEGVMAFAAQQVLNANQAMGQAQSPEQQLVALEQKKVELEQQKLQLDAAQNAAEAALDAQKLQLEEAKLTKEAMESGQSAAFRQEKADLDRASKETMKTLELLTKVSLEQNKAESQESMKTMEQMIKAALDQEKLDLNYETIRTRVLEKSASIDKDKQIKMAELVSDMIKEETKKKGD